MCTGGPYEFEQDLKEVNLHMQIADLLGVKYLSPVALPSDDRLWPVQGVLFGLAKRPLVSLPTQLRSGMPCVNVFFLVDTTAPISKISPSAFNALGSDAALPNATHGIVNGVHCHQQICTNDIPVLGADYFTRIGGVIAINYNQDTISVDRACT